MSESGSAPCFRKKKERIRGVILSKTHASCHFSQTNCFLFFVPSALFQSYFNRSDQADMLLGFVGFVFVQGSKDLKKRNFRKGVVSGRSAVCIILTL